MAGTIYERHLYDCESDSIKTYFEYGDSVVFCTGKKTTAYDGLNKIKCTQLAVISKCSMEQYQGPSEIKRYFRSENLVIQGIISFFTGRPLTVYHSNRVSEARRPIKYRKKKTHLSIEGVDYTSDLEILLKKLAEDPDLTITLLDRWRKAIYLKAESRDADLYYDEATLSFFHILELFGDTVNKELRTKLEDSVEKMMQQHFASCYFSDVQVKQMVDQNKKAVNSILVGDFLSLSVKIKYFLEKYGLLDDNVACFVDDMIKVRNAVAHGRITYQKMFMWPLSPFFSLAKDLYENMEFLFFLTAVMISRYVGMRCWEEEWMETKSFLMPSQQAVESFLKGEVHLEKDALVKGNKYNITWKTLFDYYVKKIKKERRMEVESAVADLFLDTLVNEENAPDIFNISLIFADSGKRELQEKAAGNIRLIVEKRWHSWSNIRDASIYLDFYSVNVTWYKEFLRQRDAGAV